MGRLDLDAARAERDAARAEAKAEPHELVFKGQAFELPPELPAEFAFALADNDSKRALEELLGDAFSTFWELSPSVDDLTVFGEGIARLYGIGPGEAPASDGSSSNGSSRSRPTSPATTAST